MNLLQDIIKKVMNLYEDFYIRNYDLRAISLFYKCYYLCVSYSGFEDKFFSKREKIFNNLIDAYVNSDDRLIDKYKNIMYNFILRDIKIVSKVYDEISEINENSEVNKSTLWRKGVLAFPFYEIEARVGE